VASSARHVTSSLGTVQRATARLFEVRGIATASTLGTVHGATARLFEVHIIATATTSAFLATSTLGIVHGATTRLFEVRGVATAFLATSSLGTIHGATARLFERSTVVVVVALIFIIPKVVFAFVGSAISRWAAIAAIDVFPMRVNNCTVQLPISIGRLDPVLLLSMPKTFGSLAGNSQRNKAQDQEVPQDHRVGYSFECGHLLLR
jgi:hypothetical protein